AGTAGVAAGASLGAAVDAPDALGAAPAAGADSAWHGTDNAPIASAGSAQSESARSDTAFENRRADSRRFGADRSTHMR
ncbi:MAG TPA: hypothetical protein VG963_01380, partial [Polyangiaceae bacterium]|nr:hypothetical protein [Polyangiaceae bacterium]